MCLAVPMPRDAVEGVGEPAAPEGPATAGSRRREVAADSARSLLLTVLGEFVHPRRAPVWTAVLVEALGLVGVEEKSARQALARTAGEGLLEPSRHGRRAQWSLTMAGTGLLTEGTRRIYGFMRVATPWDGRWLVLTVAIPETQRKLRHRLRTRLTWAGLGSPVPGLWVVPDAGKEAEVAAVISDLGVAEHAYAWVGSTAPFADERRLVSEAWSLADVEGRYCDFIARFSAVTPADPADAFAWQVRLIQEWRRFPFLDPALPPALLDHEWAGRRAADLFHRLHDDWHEAAQEHWESLTPR
ncbi:MAG: phenylacetic acid degradation operon negative regulatory protein [Actinomycetota bacterium]|jgi:phenylacetic acid degradation operon negative regulatory protein|nr:Transcriptional regulator, PaaX family [Cryptosporangiaceae bacterium]MDQ1678473.1 phenylacetic acid degradation operon negative regulatory protein [Actinomycetota bacterium]